MSKNDNDIEEIILRINGLENKINYFMQHRANDFFSDPLFSKRNDFSVLSNAWNSNEHHFYELTNYLKKHKPIKKLKDVGLINNELDLKLHVIDQSLQELELQEKKFRFFKPEGRSKGFKIWHELNKLRNFWQQYFDHINTILSTLGIIGIPGSDAINEFVMVLEKLLHWWNKRKK